VIEYSSQPGTGLPQYKVRWKGYDYHQDEWVMDKDIAHSGEKNFWLNGNKGTTYSKRPVNKHMWQNGKGKSREETLKMIAAERDRILNPPVTSHATIVKPPVKKLVILIIPLVMIMSRKLMSCTKKMDFNFK